MEPSPAFTSVPARSSTGTLLGLFPQLLLGAVGFDFACFQSLYSGSRGREVGFSCPEKQ